MNERDMNEAIDRTVREMMTADARAGMTERVLFRLRTTPSHRLSWRPVTAGVSLAAAAALLLVFLMPASREQSSIPQPPTVASRPPEIGNVPSPTTTSETTPRERTRAAPRQPSRPVVATVTDDGLPNFEIAPLQPLDAIALAPIAHDWIVPKPVVVEPLIPIAELRIEPLSIPDERSKGEL